MAQSLPKAASLMPEHMTRFQVAIVILCVCIVGLDGFDVLVMAFTAPAIAKDWRLDPAAIGGLFSAGLAGMGFGALLIASLGDRIGRRRTILLCLLILILGMTAAAFARTVFELAAIRAGTGLGIGGVLANANVLVAEYSSSRRRNLCVALMSVGYPIGATIGGLAAVYLIQAWGWRSVFLFGALVALVLLPVTLRLMPESLDFLLARRPKRALEQANRVLRKLDLPQMGALPPLGETDVASRTSPLALIRPGMLATTLTASFLYFSVMATCYFLLSWTPKLLTDLGLSMSGGISGSLLMNVGGTVGCVLFGFYAQRLGLRRLAAAFMIGLAVLTMVFGFLPPAGGLLLVAAAALGFCLHTSITVLYVVVPGVFPAAIRTTGTGFAMSVGRLGAVCGPFAAGLLMQHGFGRSAYCAILALPMLAGILLLYALRTPATVATGGLGQAAAEPA